MVESYADHTQNIRLLILRCIRELKALRGRLRDLYEMCPLSRPNVANTNSTTVKLGSYAGCVRNILLINLRRLREPRGVRGRLRESLGTWRAE